MNTVEYDDPRDFVSQAWSEGRAEGRAEGRLDGEARLILRLLSQAFGPLSAEAHIYILTASASELNAIAGRLLFSTTVLEALGVNAERVLDELPEFSVQQLQETAIIANLATDLFDGDIYRVRSWFEHLSPMLENVSPRTLIRTGEYRHLLNYVLNVYESQKTLHAESAVS